MAPPAPRDSRRCPDGPSHRYIAYLAKLSEDQELAFTTEKINQTFSNYSAWHHRSAVLPLLHSSAAASTSAASSVPEPGAVPAQLYARPGEGAARGGAGGAGTAGEIEGLPPAAAEREFDLVAQARPDRLPLRPVILCLL